jgi:hypothetical protein
MTIEVGERGSIGWWMQRMFNQLANPQRRARLQLLYDYWSGNPPLPEGSQNARDAYMAFQKKACSNFASLVCAAVAERMRLVGFRTAVDDDVTGDAEVGAFWRRAAMKEVSGRVHTMMLAMSESYAVVGGMDEETQAPLVSAEDPRFMIGEPDPDNPRRLRAALKVLRDDADSEDRAYLYLPGAVLVAARKTGRYDMPAGMNRYGLPIHGVALPNFDPRSWEWVPERSGRLTHNRIPVVRFDNEFGLGEFEPHLSVLDRINHQILQRMVVCAMQAFRQRAIRGLPLVYPSEHPMAGQVIDYDKMFESDPGAIWHLPIGAEMWESAVGDLTPILAAVSDDLRDLASGTRTPMHMLTPGGENQSAEGANLSREQLVFKTEDRITLCDNRWPQVASLMMLHAGQPERADLAKLEAIWASAQRLSLAERADAASKLKDVLPRRTLLIDILGMSPGEADQTMTELADEQLLAQQVAAATLALTPVGVAAGGQQAGIPGQAASAAGTPGAGQQGEQRALTAGAGSGGGGSQ